MIFGNTVTWVSRKQTLVAQSTCEAEYVADAHAASEGIWMLKLLRDMKLNVPLPLKLDNEGCIQMSKVPETKKSKHIDVKYHFLREQVLIGNLILEKIPSAEQTADIFTKALGRQLYVKHREALGIH